jgi:hypothetical protein
MAFGIAEIAIGALGLVLGGSGVATIHALFVRPRAYWASRQFKVVHVLLGEDAQIIELLVRNAGTPLGVAEVEWWNQGKRATPPITVEVVTCAPIKAWRINPPSDDVDREHSTGDRVRQSE